MRAIGTALALLCLMAVPSSAGAAASSDPGGYKIVHAWKVGGEGGWDGLTVDSKARRLYFGRGNRMQALDLDRGTVAGEVADTPGIHCIALAPGLGRGFTSNGRDSSVTIFDIRTLGTLLRVSTGGRNPDAIVFEPVTKRVFVFNAGSRNATAIDAASGAVVGMIALDGQPEFAAVDGKGSVFVNLEDSSAVLRFDARTFAIQGRWSLGPGEGPTGIAIDVAHHRTFSACGNQQMVVLDYASGHVLATLPIGKGVDGADYDPAHATAFSSNGEGTLTVVNEEAPGHFVVAATIPTQRGARTMALDPRTHHLYLAAAEYGEAPAPTTEHPHPRAPMIPGSFVILELAR